MIPTSVFVINNLKSLKQQGVWAGSGRWGGGGGVGWGWGGLAMQRFTFIIKLSPSSAETEFLRKYLFCLMFWAGSVLRDCC